MSPRPVCAHDRILWIGGGTRPVHVCCALWWWRPADPALLVQRDLDMWEAELAHPSGRESAR
jgi:hypothetical protein